MGCGERELHEKHMEERRWRCSALSGVAVSLSCDDSLGLPREPGQCRCNVWFSGILCTRLSVERASIAGGVAAVG